MLLDATCSQAAESWFAGPLHSVSFSSQSMSQAFILQTIGASYVMFIRLFFDSKFRTSNGFVSVSTTEVAHAIDLPHFLFIHSPCSRALSLVPGLNCWECLRAYISFYTYIYIYTYTYHCTCVTITPTVQVSKKFGAKGLPEAEKKKG